MIAKDKYALRISEIEEELNKKEKELADLEQCINGSNRWMEAFLQFRGAEELTRNMAVELLEKVEVFGDKRIHIKFRFRNEYEFLKARLDAEDEGRDDDHGRTVCS